MTTTIPAQRLVGGFSWPECPRWHRGRLYFSDFFSGRVMTIDDAGAAETYVDLNRRVPVRGRAIVASGTGFLPDGRLLIVSMFEQTVLVFDGAELAVHADLSEVAVGPINDMVVDSQGRAYVTQIGGDIFLGETPAQAPILIVEPDGSVHRSEEGGLLAGANGIAISADGGTLVVAETFGNRILAYELTAHGKLGAGRVFADDPGYPDGLCMDEQGAVWAAASSRAALVRVVEGGEITHEIPMPYAEAGIGAACCLGGPDRDNLYIACGFEVTDFDKSVREAQGSLWVAPAPIPAGTTRP